MLSMESLEMALKICKKIPKCIVNAILTSEALLVMWMYNSCLNVC